MSRWGVSFIGDMVRDREDFGVMGMSSYAPRLFHRRALESVRRSGVDGVLRACCGLPLVSTRALGAHVCCVGHEVVSSRLLDRVSEINAMDDL